MTRKKGRFGKLLLLVTAIAVGAVAALSMIPLSPLKHSVEAKLSETLGRRVTIDSVRLSLLSSPHLILTDLTALEDPAFGEGVFLKAREVRAGVDVIQYLRSRQIVIDSITLESPQIDLVKNRDGAWSWTSLGKQIAEISRGADLVSEPVSYSAIFPSPSLRLLESALHEINIDNGSVELRDRNGPEPSETLYKNIVLNASLTPHGAGDSQNSREAKGNLIVQSEEGGGSDAFKANLPFDITINGSGTTMLSVSGSIGPGPIETKTISIGAFAIDGEIDSSSNAPLTGKGQMSVDDLDIHTANLSERVARALKIDQIGDMNPGTTVANLATDFQISEGTVHTTGLRIQQLDGLGDATAPNGNFKIQSSLVVNYAAMMTLSPEATLRVKTVSPAVGLAVTILETNNRVSLPLNVNGDIRNPDIQVDVSRIF